MTTITRRITRAIALAAILFAATRVIAPYPAHAVSPGEAAAMGLGSFALGAAVARPGYGYAYPAYGYGYNRPYYRAYYRPYYRGYYRPYYRAYYPRYYRRTMAVIPRITVDWDTS